MNPAFLLLLAALAPADASAPVDGPPSPSSVRVEDAGELQGEWEVVSCLYGQEDDTTQYQGYRWVLAGTCARLVEPTGISVTSALRTDLTSRPAKIDEPYKDGLPRLGIYRRTGDEMLWAEGLPGDGRPSSFEPAEGVYLWTLRLVKK